MPKRVLTSIVLVLLLALTPAAAFADGGAGDQQYQDPLTAPSAPKQTKKKAATTPTSTTPAATTAPAATSAPTSTAATQPSTSTSASSRELPRTGSPAGLIGLAGGVLIVSGAALRRRTATQ
jgi:LPXTG-motif cell wall-anchored protein